MFALQVTVWMSENLNYIYQKIGHMICNVTIRMVKWKIFARFFKFWKFMKNHSFFISNDILRLIFAVSARNVADFICRFHETKHYYFFARIAWCVYFLFIIISICSLILRIAWRKKHYHTNAMKPQTKSDFMF